MIARLGVELLRELERRRVAVGSSGVVNVAVVVKVLVVGGRGVGREGRDALLREGLGLLGG